MLPKYYLVIKVVIDFFLIKCYFLHQVIFIYRFGFPPSFINFIYDLWCSHIRFIDIIFVQLAFVVTSNLIIFTYNSIIFLCKKIFLWYVLYFCYLFQTMRKVLLIYIAKKLILCYCLNKYSLQWRHYSMLILLLNKIVQVSLLPAMLMYQDSYSFEVFIYISTFFMCRIIFLLLLRKLAVHAYMYAGPENSSFNSSYLFKDGVKSDMISLNLNYCALVYIFKDLK